MLDNTTAAQQKALVAKYVDKYAKTYKVRPCVKVRRTAKLGYARGVTYDWDSRVSMTFGTYVSSLTVEYIAVHELAHVHAGPRQNHNKVFYRSLWRLCKDFKVSTELLDRVEEGERNYKPQNSRTFAALRVRYGA